MKKNFQFIFVLLLVVCLTACGTNDIEDILIEELGSNSSSSVYDKLPSAETNNNTQTNPDEYDYVLVFPSDSYPETALHIYNAIENGHSDVCTIDREGADENRKESLKGIDTMKGYDRDEWPMAMCEEGGYGASVAYIDSSDNRGAGSWVGHQLSAYENGEKILFIVEKPKNLFGSNLEQELNLDEDIIKEDLVYNSCAEVIADGNAPLFKGEPGYSTKLDRDGDGIACEV